jgi:hypothetical protein
VYRVSGAVEDKSERARVVPLRIRVVGLVLLGSIAVGCPCIRGAVNASPGLRWWLFSNFGAQRMCPEMLKRGAPLRLTPDGNTVGRFFPSRCQHTVNDARQTITIDFGGTGFAWTPLAGRVGFMVDAALEYRPDFYMAEDAVYVWAKTNAVLREPTFSIGAVENKVVDWAARGPVGYMANTFGGQIVSGHLASGFTVVHTDEGDEFALGILRPPQRPKKPFNTSQGDRFVFANETTEIRYNQIDFLGPFEVADDDQALFFRLRLEGPPVDFLLFHRSVADVWRDEIQRGAIVPPAQMPIQSFVVQPGPEQRRRVKLPRGQYMVAIDNSGSAGTVAPPWNPLSAFGSNSAVLSYTAELGEDDDDF